MAVEDEWEPAMACYLGSAPSDIEEEESRIARIRYDMALTYSAMPEGPSLLTGDYTVGAPQIAIMLYGVEWKDALERYEWLDRYTAEWCQRYPLSFTKSELVERTWRWPWCRAGYSLHIKNRDATDFFARLVADYRRDMQLEFARTAYRLAERYEETGMMERSVFKYIAQFMDLAATKRP